MNWNFASADWCCPAAVNDVRRGGRFKFTMAAKGESSSFDLGGEYYEVYKQRYLCYTLDDGRMVKVSFREVEEEIVEIYQEFEPEETNPVEIQRAGWQAILNNFKEYAERLEEAAKTD